jgi:hypothetical protein
MEKISSIVTASFFLLVLVLGAAAQPSGANPAETGLGMYRGVVIGQFNAADLGKEVACDFGSAGAWVFHGNVWSQITGANPDWIIGVGMGAGADEKLIGDFGAMGLWLWSYSDYPGTWVQASGLDSSWAFAVDDDGDTKQEIYVDFGTTGLWRGDIDGPSWAQVSALDASHGLRMDSFISAATEEACVFFPAVGTWAIWRSGSSFIYQQLTGTVSDEDDHASAKFRNGIAEDLVADFGGLGLWLLTDQSYSDWHQISTDAVDRIKTVSFGGNNPGLVMKSGSRTGLYYWHYDGSYPGVEAQISATRVDPYGFCEPFSYTTADNDDELAVDQGASGLWMYEYNNGTWTLLSANDPVFMVAGDIWNDGKDTALIVDFGVAGLWLYDGQYHDWYQMSALSPDDNEIP